MARPKSQRSGRKKNNERIRELVAILGSLSRTGDSVSVDAIATRMGLSSQEARDLMNIVCDARGEETEGLLISCNDDETEYTLQFPGTRGRPIRLTPAETIAVSHALDLAGVEPDDAIRERVRAAYSSPEVMEDEVRRALGSTADDLGPLYLCARSQAEGCSLIFDYNGLKDSEARPRRGVLRSLHTTDGHWYASMLDLDLGESRTFRVDRMENVRMGGPHALPKTVIQGKTQRVRITFLDRSYYRLFDWPGLRVLEDTTNGLVCDIPYYGEYSTWLLRRICAGKGCIIVDDEQLMSRAREYAEKLLRNT